jgi:hypothetical protein
MHTPFQAEGIVTNLYTDANGTQHINLHRIPDRTGLWRYLGTTLLLLTMLGCGVSRPPGFSSLSAPSPASGRDSEILRKLPESGSPFLAGPARIILCATGYDTLSRNFPSLETHHAF